MHTNLNTSSKPPAQEATLGSQLSSHMLMALAIVDKQLTDIATKYNVSKEAAAAMLTLAKPIAESLEARHIGKVPDNRKFHHGK